MDANKTRINVEDDGITHIRVSPTAASYWGRMLCPQRIRYISNVFPNTDKVSSYNTRGHVGINFAKQLITIEFQYNKPINELIQENKAKIKCEIRMDISSFRNSTLALFLATNTLPFYHYEVSNGIAIPKLQALDNIIKEVADELKYMHDEILKSRKYIFWLDKVLLKSKDKKIVFRNFIEAYYHMTSTGEYDMYSALNSYYKGELGEKLAIDAFEELVLK